MVKVCSLLFCLQGMEAIQASGKVKSIGVSNFNILQLERLLALCMVPPAVNQVLHIYYSSFVDISRKKSDTLFMQNSYFLISLYCIGVDPCSIL